MGSYYDPKTFGWPTLRLGVCLRVEDYGWFCQQMALGVALSYCALGLLWELNAHFVLGIS